MTTTTEQPIIIRYPHLIYRNEVSESALVFATSSETAESVATYGWDTVYAIKFENVNKAIAKKKSSPTNFTVSDPEGSATNVHGKFGDWQVIPGGAGHLLLMSVPITTGTMTYRGQDYSMNNIQVEIEIKLEYIPNLAKSGSTDLKAKKSAVVVEDIKFPAGQAPNIITQSVMKGFLGQWFNENLGQFNYVFSSVLLNQRLEGNKDFAWLKPKEVGYANVEDIFAVLATTGDRSKANLPYQVSPYAIPKGAPSGFIISGERTLMDMILPGMPGIFPGSKPEDFELVNATTLRNKNQIKLPFKTDKGDYTGVIEPAGFILAIEVGVLHINMPKMMVNVSPGIDVEIDLNEWVKMTIQEKPDGTKTLKFEQAKDYPTTVSHQVIFADWVKGVQIGAGIVAGILLAALGLGSGAKFVEMGLSKITIAIVTFLILALVGGALTAIISIPQYIELATSGQFDKLPSLEKFIANGILTVDWPDSTGFKILSAQLNGSMQIGIDPKFDH